MIDDTDGHFPSRLIIFTCTALRHALRQWQKNKGVHPKASKSKMKADRPDHSYYFNGKNDGGNITSCCAALRRKLLTLPGVADTYTVLMNSWNTLLESHQQRVFNNTLDTVKDQIQQAENPTPAVGIGVEAAHVDNAIRLDYLTSVVALEEAEIGSTDPTIPTEHICTDEELYSGMPAGSGSFADQRSESNPIPTSSGR